MKLSKEQKMLEDGVVAYMLSCFYMLVIDSVHPFGELPISGCADVTQLWVMEQIKIPF